MTNEQMIAALNEALATGAKRVTFRAAGEERTVEYRSRQEMLDELARLQGRKRPKAGFAGFSRGDR